MLQMLSVVDPRFILMVLLGSVAGLFVGAIPGLSVSMATALLVSITYTWEHSDALAMIMGVYVVGVFSGAVSAILINIPGAPSSVVTTLDGYPMSKKGQSYKALFTATIYSFIGSLFGLLALGLLAEPVSRVAIKFTKMDYFLLALFGLATVGSVSTKNYAKGLISVMIGLVISMIGLDPLMGTKRLTFGRRQHGTGTRRLLWIRGSSLCCIQHEAGAERPCNGKDESQLERDLKELETFLIYIDDRSFSRSSSGSRRTGGILYRL